MALRARVAEHWGELYSRLSRSDQPDEAWFLAADCPMSNGYLPTLADLAANNIIKARLRHAELLRSFALSRPADDVANARHQLRAQLQVFRFVGGKPDVEEYVAAAAGSFQFLSHRCRLS